MTCRKCQREAPSDALYCPYCGLSFQSKANTRKPRTRPNGTGTAFKRGNSWYAQVTIGDKPVIRNGKPASQLIRATKGGFARKKDALEYCSKLREDALRQKSEKPSLTMQQIYDAWLPTHEIKVSKATMDCYKAAWKYFAPIHDMTFSDIDLDDLQECVNDCPHGRRTKENMKAIAGLLMKYAIPRHYTDMNYAEYIHTGNDEKGTHPAFSAEQIELIHRQIGITPYAEYIYVLIHTGFRPSELFALTHESITDGVIYGGAKTKAGKGRAVPISAKIQPIIDAQAQNESQWLFPKLDGGQMKARYFRDLFYAIIDAAGIQPIPNQEHPAYYVPYSCRHTFANLIKDVSGSDKDKAGLIGHEDYRTTQKHYQSAELDALKAIINQI